MARLHLYVRMHAASPLISILLSVIIALILFFIIHIPLMVKRLHDFNMRGWWLLTFFIPFVGLILLSVIYLVLGNKGHNRFGTAPKKAEKFEYIIAIIFIPLHLSFVAYNAYNIFSILTTYLNA